MQFNLLRTYLSAIYWPLRQFVQHVVHITKKRQIISQSVDKSAV